MFKSFFPNPKLLFISAAIWAIIMVIFWEAGGERLLLTLFHLSDPKIPISVTRFWSAPFLIFYLYFLICITVFALFWARIAPHRWQAWSIWGSALIIFITWFQVAVGVAINAWQKPFYDLIQKALQTPGTVQSGELYSEITIFLWLALVYIIVSVLSSFFVSHYVFRWRTAMNEYYIEHWQHLRHIEGAAQRVQEDTMRFASTVEGLGVKLIESVMTLIAFFPILIALSPHVKMLPIIGEIPYGLVYAAIAWSLIGTLVLALVGIRLPGLEFNNQRVEAAYRKELVYGEDNLERAAKTHTNELFNNVRKNYFRLYFHYMYFNVARFIYLQIDVIFGLVLLFPSIVIPGTLTLGLMNQILNAFGQVRNSFQYLISAWPTLVELMSIHKRLRSFEKQLDTMETETQVIAPQL